ncbi:MAG: SDR family NAD(P)-dependent oxidoreductase [Actinomycetota bacterium]|nr:SDR family NAD(P)-dependent oxidoreductase [Actinomycetota bacterium]
MRAAVTGGCGFIGSALVHHLVRAGHDVLVLDDLSLGRIENLAPDTRDSTAVVQVDVRDADAVADTIKRHAAEVVYHLAAIHFIPTCDRDPRRAIEVNVVGTQSVLDAVVRSGAVRRIVLASTGAVYAPDDRPHRETSAVEPVDIYGMTKLWAERLVALFRTQTGTEAAIARLFNTYGPGETNAHFIPTTITQVQRGGDLELGNLSSCRDYVFVDDVARALLAMAAAPAADGPLVCNVGTGGCVDGHTVVETICALLGRNPTIHVAPDRVRVSDRPKLVSDPTRARELLGWEAQVQLEDGLRQTFARPSAAGVELDSGV